MGRRPSFPTADRAAAPPARFAADARGQEASYRPPRVLLRATHPPIHAGKRPVIERALIHVAGPPGAGKTALVVQFLRRAGRLVAAARCIRDDELRVPKESAPTGHAELSAYRAAGADPVALYRFPASHADWDAFCTTNLMTDYFEAVLLEGALPVEWVDLTVYVGLVPRLVETRR